MEQEWINPIIFSVGPIPVRWYGALYVLSFLIGGLILNDLANKKFWPLPKKSIDTYVTWLIISMFLGARFFYVFIYNWEYYSEHLNEILMVWKGGLSFHGAALGMGLATWVFAKKNQVYFFQLTDCLALAAAPGLFLGRIGNFINGELYGRVTDSWAGVVFPGGGPFPRHPSQVYEGFLEGILIFFLLFSILRRQRFYGVISGAFLLVYGLVRFVIEFFREPDVQLGYFFTYLTLGQVLSLMMIPLAFMVLKAAKSMQLKNPLIPR